MAKSDAYHCKIKKLYDVAPVTYPAYADTEVAKSWCFYRKHTWKTIYGNPFENNKELNADAQLIINSNL
jgi:hypothetical protein